MPNRNIIFSFSFEDEEDVHHVMQHRPWSIQNYLMVIKEWHHEVVFDDIEFEDSPFWVQVSGLSPNKVTH